MPRYLIFACLIAAAAPGPVGTLITADPFDINGVRFGSAGVYSWPVFAHDRIKTETSAATIYLPDRGRLYLASETVLELDLSANRPSATLVSGQLGFLLTGQLTIKAGKHFTNDKDWQGVLSLSGEKIGFTPGSPKIPGSPARLPPPLPSAGQYLPAGSRN